MANRTLSMDEATHAYLLEVAVDEPAILRELREETSRLEFARMQIAPEQGAFMGWLVRLTGARRAIEIGTFTGYSALTIALAMPDDGELLCCDVSEEYAQVARRYFREAGVAGRVDLRVAAAVETLAALPPEAHGTYDFAFIDADKVSYDAYYEACLELLRPGGVVAIDNVLWGGSVADPSDREPSTEALRALNAKVAADPRVHACLVPIGDGLTLATKIG